MRADQVEEIEEFVRSLFSDDGDQESHRHRARRRWIAATDRHHAEVAWPTGPPLSRRANRTRPALDINDRRATG
jgi:hypothetical protein